MNPYQPPTTLCRTPVDPEKWVNRRILAAGVVSVFLALVWSLGCGYAIEQLRVYVWWPIVVAAWLLAIVIGCAVIVPPLSWYCDYVYREGKALQQRNEERQ